MSSVGEELRAELRERFARLPALERVEMALRLGRRDVELYARARCVNERTAREVLRSARRFGRRSSRALGPTGA